MYKADGPDKSYQKYISGNKLAEYIILNWYIFVLIFILFYLWLICSWLRLKTISKCDDYFKSEEFCKMVEQGGGGLARLIRKKEGGDWEASKRKKVFECKKDVFFFLYL